MTTTKGEKTAAAEAVNWVREQLAFSYADIAFAVKAEERTVRRWKDQRVAPCGSHRDKIKQLSEMKQLLLAVFGTGAAAAVWMKTPLPALRGRTPGAAFRKGQLATLIDILATVESGAYT